MSGEASLKRLSGLAGVVTSYRDAWGNIRHTSDDTQRALLAAMGIDAATSDAIASAIRDLEDSPWRRPLEPVLVTPQTSRLSVPLTLPARDQTLAWRFETETGEAHLGEARFGELPLLDRRKLDGDIVERRTLDLPIAVGPGYHRLRLFGSGVDGSDGEGGGISRAVIVTPQSCHLPRLGRGQGRPWGIGTQLYGLRSARNWGIGDFSDLARFVGMAAGLGADAVGLNPLHALFPGNPERISPYSPSDRRFLNTLYVDVEAIPDFAECEACRQRLGNSDIRRRLAMARKLPLVDYPEIAALKREVLELVFHSFHRRHLDDDPSGATSNRGAAFRSFQRAGAEALLRMATFQALSEHFGPETPWWDWPAPFRECDSTEVAEFVAAHREQVEFFQYLQWQADEQLRRAARTAQDAGMAIGLYRDLALAADPAGAEAWMNRRLIAHGVRVGAPPDDWNLKGQDWGLPAYDPRALRAAAYAPFAETLRANMAHGGALRIDHVMGLERMYWIPRGAKPLDGGYVRYPVADLFGVLTLESARAKCLVIGEDLGTLPEGFQERMRGAGVLSYRLLYFSQDGRGEFIAPECYQREALVAIGTHDLATFPGFWRGRDLDVRAGLGLYPSRETETLAREQRARERRNLIGALKRDGLLPDTLSGDTNEFSFELVEALYRFIARSPALLLLLHLEDVLGEENQVNVPGTVSEQPNWRRRMPVDLDELERDPRVRAIAAAICLERRRHLRDGPAGSG